MPPKRSYLYSTIEEKGANESTFSDGNVGNLALASLDL